MVRQDTGDCGWTVHCGASDHSYLLMDERRQNMKLIDPNEIKFVIAPIAPICIGEQVHFENVAFKHDIEQIQRIEAEPVKHAHWIINAQPGTKGDPDFVCSSCFCISPIRGYTRYCPNCGARMDGEIEGKRKRK